MHELVVVGVGQLIHAFQVLVGDVLDVRANLDRVGKVNKQTETKIATTTTYVRVVHGVEMAGEAIGSIAHGDGLGADRGHGAEEARVQVLVHGAIPVDCVGAGAKERLGGLPEHQHGHHDHGKDGELHGEVLVRLVWGG